MNEKLESFRGKDERVLEKLKRLAGIQKKEANCRKRECTR